MAWRRRKRRGTPGVYPANYVVDRVADRAGIRRKLLEHRAWELWDQLCGGPIARNSRPSRIDGGVLTVNVTSATWMNELVYVKDELLERLNQAVDAPPDRPVFTDIRFRLGKLYTPQATLPMPEYLEAKPPKVRRSTAEEQLEARKLVDSLPPGPGREAAEALMLRVLGSKD